MGMISIPFYNYLLITGLLGVAQEKVIHAIK